MAISSRCTQAANQLGYDTDGPQVRAARVDECLGGKGLFFFSLSVFCCPCFSRLNELFPYFPITVCSSRLQYVHPERKRAQTGVYIFGIFPAIVSCSRLPYLWEYQSIQKSQIHEAGNKAVPTPSAALLYCCI